MRYLLDTNTCIDIMRQRPAVIEHLSAHSPNDCAISTITTYELYTGVEKCTSPEKEQAKVDQLLLTIAALPFDEDAAREAARVRALLESAGLMIGPYDVLLAGQALAASLTLVSANTSEFNRVPDLALEDWREEA